REQITRVVAAGGGELVAALLHEQAVDRAAALAFDRQPVGDLLVDAHRRGAGRGGRVVVGGDLLAVGRGEARREQGEKEERALHRPVGIHSASPTVAIRLLVKWVSAATSCTAMRSCSEMRNVIALV